MTAAPDPVRRSARRLRPRPGRPRAAGEPHPGLVHAPGRPVAAGVPRAARRDGDARRPARTPTWSPRSPCSRSAGTASTRRSSSPTSCCRWSWPAWTSRSSPASGRWSPRRSARSADVDALPPLEPDAARLPDRRRCGRWSRELGADAADRVRRRAVHAGHLPDRGRPVQGARPHQGVHVRRARGVVRGCWSGWRCRAATFLRVQVDAGASAVQLFDSWAGVLSAADYAARVLPHSRAVFDGARRPGRAADPLRRRHRRAAAADRRRRRRRRRRRLAGAAGRGRPPGRARPLAAGQPRPRRPAGRPGDRRPRGAPGRRAGPRRARAHLQPRPRRAARHRPGRADPRRRAGARAHRAR